MQDEILNIFKTKINRALKNRVKKIILFGSRARGDNAPDSDYDVLLVLDEISPEIKKLINNLEGEILYDHNAVFSAFPYTFKDIERRKYDPFIINAQKEGKEL